MSASGPLKPRRPSGSNLTFESYYGLPADSRNASLADAHRNIVRRFGGRSASAFGFDQGSQRATEARVAGPDRALAGRGGGRQRNHAPDGHVENLRLALAGTVLRRRIRGVGARQDAALARQAA